MEKQKKERWASLLQQAVSVPGSIEKAFSAFHNYSLGNQLMALFQCYGRGIAPGPINTYKRWQEMGRTVKKGEKAIVLCMPITMKSKDKVTGDERKFTLFVEKPRWFVVSQTEGPEVEFPALPDWNREVALKALDITEIPFDLTDGNILGYARKREVAINPVAPNPMNVLLHELGHIVLGHTAEADFHDSPKTARNIREVEAESVTLLCGEALGLPGQELSRGYIQNWYEGDAIPEDSAKKIFKAADMILKAGRA